MPSKSAKQARYMEGIAHGMKPKNGKKPPPKRVAKEFVQADMRGKDAFNKSFKRIARGK